MEGFRLGAISEFGPDVVDGGAFIIAPDGSRVGLIWDIGREPYLIERRGFEDTRWGVGPEGAERVLEDIVPRLRPKWEAWRKQFGRA